MPQKQATFMSYGLDEQCAEIRKFIEDAGVRLIVRDLKTNPLSYIELDRMFGYNPLGQFLNPLSKDYTKLGLDKQIPERRELLQMMAENPSIIRGPIIRNTRLLTVGCDRKVISALLQISPNGGPINDSIPDNPPRRNNNHNNHRRAMSPSGK